MTTFLEPNTLIDSGIFNDVMMGYLDLATYRAGLDEDTRKKIRTEFYFILDEYNAMEARNVYNSGLPEYEKKRRARNNDD